VNSTTGVDFSIPLIHLLNVYNTTKSVKKLNTANCDSRLPQACCCSCN
jgi:hypothetical protein